MRKEERGYVSLWIDGPSILNGYKPRPVEINWKSVGSVPLNEAESFAKDILALVKKGKSIMRKEGKR